MLGGTGTGGMLSRNENYPIPDAVFQKSYSDESEAKEVSRDIYRDLKFLRPSYSIQVDKEDLSPEKISLSSRRISFPSILGFLNDRPEAEIQIERNEEEMLARLYLEGASPEMRDTVREVLDDYMEETGFTV